MFHKTRVHRYGWAGMALSTLLVLSLVPALAQQPPAETIFRNVRVLDVVDGHLGSPTNVVVRGKTIVAIGASANTASGAKTIDGKGRTLMPGLIDVHVQTFGAVSLSDLHDPKTTPEQLGAATAKLATDVLLRGFTAVRAARSSRSSERSTAEGSGAAHLAVRGDHLANLGARRLSHAGRALTPLLRKPSRAEEEGATFIADGRDEVLTATRENLRMGASQIKIMGGGGTSSAYDPIDGPRLYARRGPTSDRGGRHGQLLDEPTIKLMAQKGMWLSAQNLIPDTPSMTAERGAKRKRILEGNARIWPLAKNTASSSHGAQTCFSSRNSTLNKAGSSSR